MTNLKREVGFMCAAIVIFMLLFGFVLLTGWNKENFIPIIVFSIIVLAGVLGLMTKWGYGDEQPQ